MVESEGRSLKVISLLGLPRSGTTIASEFLGAHEGYINVGEVQSLTTRSLAKRGKCQCGQSVFDCEFWSSVLKSLPKDDIARLKWLRKKLIIVAFTLKLGIQTYAVRKSLQSLGKLYTQIYSHSGGKILIDMSKNPLWHFVLSVALKRRTYIIFWYRNGEGVIGSFEARGERYYPIYLVSYLILRRFFFLSGRVSHHETYEEFATDPGRFLSSVDMMVGYSGMTSRFERGNVDSFDRVTGHSIAGNPSRLVKGRIKISISIINHALSGMGRITAKIINAIQ